MQKKLGIVIILLLLCIGSMTSCFVVVNKNGAKNETKQPEETQAKIERVPALTDALEPAKNSAVQALDGLFADKDFGNQNFTVTFSNNTFTGLNTRREAEFLRGLQIQNDLISNKLNCSVYVNQYPYSSVLSDMQAALSSGAFYADLLLVPQNSIGTLRKNGLIYDLNALYGDSFGGDCYDSLDTAQLAGGNALYGVVGEGAVSPGAYMCVYFNKTITDTYDLTDYLYTSAKDGSWTIDTMFEVDGKCTFHEIPALAVESADLFIESMFGASGMKYFNTGISTQPTVADNGERLDMFIGKMKGYMEYPECMYSESAYDMFLNGESVFYIGTLDRAADLNNNFGILPLPKLDSAQEDYHTYTTGDALVFVVPKTGARTDYSGDIMRAYNETAQIIKDAWKRDFLDAVLRDEQSYHMLGIIFDTPTYDFAYMYGEQYPSVAECSYKALILAVQTDTGFNEYVNANSVQFNADMNAAFPIATEADG